MRDLHTHTTYCDGKNTPEEMVAAAIKKGMSCIGFSGHGYTFFDESYCMSKQGVKDYCAEIAALKIKYAGKIDVLCGVEQDYYSLEATDGFDYVIGSVHYLFVGGEYFALDESPEVFEAGLKKYFNGDAYLLAEEYFKTVADVAQKTNADIIGHFDLITKFNAKNRFFDTSHPRYKAAWKAAADKLLTYGKPFEINTGAISRGYTDCPYLSDEIRQYIKAKGGTFILSSDSHSAETLCFGFDKY